MIRLLLFIKHHFPLLWQVTEKLNGLLFHILHGRRFERIIPEVLEKSILQEYSFRRLQSDDLHLLTLLLSNQTPERMRYFKPHSYDYRTLLKVHGNPAFFMFGAFINSQLVGYFFLRCFWNKKCFVGRLIDEAWEGKGIGREMNRIMYNIGWGADFRVLSTISKNNNMVMKSHANNPAIVILKELQNDFLLVEFLPQKQANNNNNN